MPPLYDMADFMRNVTPSQGLDGTHYMKARRDGNDLYEIKASGGGPFEHYEIDDVDVCLRQETGGHYTPQCTWDNDWNPNDCRFWPSKRAGAPNPYRWCPRYVSHGLVYQTGDTVEYGVWTDAQGEHRKSIIQPSYPCWVEVVQNFPMGGNIGVRPVVVVLIHGWKTNIVGDWANNEMYFYDPWLGPVMFRDVNGGIVTSQAVFDWEILADASPVGPAIPPLEGFSACAA